MSKVTDIVTKLSEPVLSELGLELWDVEYVREAGTWHLRIYIDRQEGGVSIDDCEAVSRTLDPILDENDPVPDSYIFEVSSAGLERSLKKPAHFERFLGETVEVKLYKPVSGTKLWSGVLAAYDNGNITLRREDGEFVFSPDQVANVKISLI